MEDRKLVSSTGRLKSIAAILLLLLCTYFPPVALSQSNREPTAVIVDAETGRPIEGAVALAQWHTWSGKDRAWWEGGTWKLKKAEEVFADQDGKIYIDAFWGTYVFSRKPRLTVYKPGYVLWDSKEVLPDYAERKDFDDDHRVIRLLRFESESRRWGVESKQILNPHNFHESFLYHCVDSEIDLNFNILKIFDKHEGKK